jgi:NTP pyrophosphatase (non-canonical NTP hydrolase)
MDWADYAVWVAKRKMTVKSCDDALFGIMGLMGEAGELSELYKKEYFHNKEIDEEALISEVGDVLFYLTYIIYNEGMTLDQVMSYNMEKLDNRDDKRYRP